MKTSHMEVFMCLSLMMLLQYCAGVRVVCTAVKIEVYNLPSTAHSFIAQQSGIACNATGDYTLVTITDCPALKDEPIILIYSDLTEMKTLGIYGGPQSGVVNITCNEVGENGTAQTLSNSITAMLPIRENVTLDPVIHVTSSLNVTTAIVGDPVGWTIGFPMSYFLQITNCSASAGTQMSANPVPLIANWCTEDTELITDFSSTSGSGIATATIEAFKFYNSDDVYLVCNLLVCPANNVCTTSCGGKRRSIDERASSAEESGSFETSVDKVLHIRDASSGQKLAPGMSVVFLVILCVRF